MKLTAGQRYNETGSLEILPGYDVVVAGGGTAGVVAALAAARDGARVLLIERGACLGGMLTTGNAGITMCTKFSGRPEERIRDQETLKTNPKEIQIVGGIVREITEKLLATGIGVGNEGTFGRYVFTSPEDFKHLLLQMMAEAGVQLRLHTWIASVIREGNVIHGVIVESKSGRQVIPAGYFIDATGDGDVAARAGVPYTVGVTEQDVCAKHAKIGEMQNAGVMFRVGNVNLERVFAYLEENPKYYIAQHFAQFTLAEAKARFRKNEMAAINILTDSTPGRFQVYNLPTPGVVTLCCPQIKGIDGCNADDLTRSELIMSDMLDRWMRTIKKIPGFDQSFLLQAPEMGIRETRHIQGEYLLELMDIYGQKHFDDCIGFGSHPIDTHPRPDWLKDPETAYPPRWYFQIPFRSLIAKDVDNLLVAGRCISATHEAFGCIRPTVQCMITGEAAGIAAAMCAEQGKPVRDLDLKLLRKKLIEKEIIHETQQDAEPCIRQPVTA
jgi:hypothetical protein